MALIRLALTLAFAGLAAAPSQSERAWELPNAILIIDPYAPNAIDFDKVATDGAVKAMIHQAYRGTTADPLYSARVDEARRHGLKVGLYLLGLPGDPIAQADLLIAAGRAKQVQMLALDIENLTSASMSLDNAERFIARVHDKTGRYPVFYTNYSTYAYISAHYGPDSIFAKTPLWIARFRTAHGMTDRRVWQDYTIWQFQSEINCAPCPAAYGGPGKTCRASGDAPRVIHNERCYHSVPGTRADMDVNVFRGSGGDLLTLFGD